MAALSDEDAERFKDGVALLHDGQWLDALHLWRELVEINPNHALVHYNLGLDYVQIDEHHQAMRHFDRAMAGKQAHGRC